MRWGGVVDELEVASQLDQWRIHGYVEIDPSPGYLLSPYMNQVKNHLKENVVLESSSKTVSIADFKCGLQVCSLAPMQQAFLQGWSTYVHFSC